MQSFKYILFDFFIEKNLKEQKTDKMCFFLISPTNSTGRLEVYAQQFSDVRIHLQ